MEKAQKGDLIRIVKDSWDDESHIGKIYEVTHVAGRGLTYVDELWNDGSKMAYYEDEYVIHRKAGEEDIDGDMTACASCGKEGVHTCRGAEYHAKSTQDAVNSPSHYTQGRFETIEVIEEITSGYTDGYVAYCVGNALKYEARAPFKHDTPLEDLRKAARYLAYAIDYLDAKSTQD